jgi:hypothetical protein
MTLGDINFIYKENEKPDDTVLLGNLKEESALETRLTRKNNIKI